jgi:hypothetical protein
MKADVEVTIRFMFEVDSRDNFAISDMESSGEEELTEDKFIQKVKEFYLDIGAIEIAEMTEESDKGETKIIDIIVTEKR